MNWRFWRPAKQRGRASDMVLPASLTAEDYEKLRLIMEMVNPQSQPNLNHLGELVRNIRLLSLNIKSMGYELAKELAAALPSPGETVARYVGLETSLAKQADLESDWASHWCSQLKIPMMFHRKLWELAYVFQAFYENGCLQPGLRGLGFGSGSEPQASYLASLGISSTVTDLPAEQADAQGWIDTNQHASNLDNAFHSQLVTRADFDRLVDFRPVDMTAIPSDLTGYDFCWSVCALEHLGTIQKGLEFIERSLDTIKPGGIAVHTTEFNIENNGPTIDNWPTVLFQQRHIEALASRLRAKGHSVAELNFDPGNKVLDRFIDLPPWGNDSSSELVTGLGQPQHLKVGAEGLVVTCMGMVIKKAG